MCVMIMVTAIIAIIAVSLNSTAIMTTGIDSC